MTIFYRGIRAPGGRESVTVSGISFAIFFGSPEKSTGFAGGSSAARQSEFRQTLIVPRACHNVWMTGRANLPDFVLCTFREPAVIASVNISFEIFKPKLIYLS